MEGLAAGGGYCWAGGEGEEYEDEDEDEDESSVGEEDFAFFDGVASEARTPEGGRSCFEGTELP